MTDPCPGCKQGGFCRTMACGRLKINQCYFDEPIEVEVFRLRKRVKELEKQLSDINWVLYPDRMGQ